MRAYHCSSWGLEDGYVLQHFRTYCLPFPRVFLAWRDCSKFCDHRWLHTWEETRHDSRTFQTSDMDFYKLFSNWKQLFGNSFKEFTDPWASLNPKGCQNYFTKNAKVPLAFFHWIDFVQINQKAQRRAKFAGTLAQIRAVILNCVSCQFVLPCYALLV